jgi:hypothetical protein
LVAEGGRVSLGIADDTPRLGWIGFKMASFFLQIAVVTPFNST